MALWEILIAGFALPSFWFGWQWFFRAVVAIGAIKAAAGVKDKIKGGFGLDDEKA